MKQITLLLAFIVLFTSSLTAATAATSLTTSTNIEKKVDLPTWKVKLIEKFEKKVAKISKKDKPEVNDLLAKDAKWWLKIWLLCWLGAVVFYGLGAFVLGPLYWLGYLFSLLGSVAFVVWILKLLDAI